MDKALYYFVVDYSKPIYYRELADILNEDKSALSRKLKLLVDIGLVMRKNKKGKINSTGRTI